MADRKYYVLCDSNCKFESMTKEQILTAITQAVNEGTIGDIDTGFITTVKTINGTPLKFFVGSQYEYETLTDDEKKNLFAVITNDTTKEALFSAIEELRNEIDGIADGIANGSIVAKNADEARLARYAGILVPDNLPDTEGSSESAQLSIFTTGIYVIDIYSGSESRYYTAVIIVPDMQRAAYSTIAKDLIKDVNCQVVYYPQGKNEAGTYWGVLQIEHDADYDYVYKIARCVRIANIY
jgi:hypothetical protein